MAEGNKRGNRLIAGYNRMMEQIRSTADEADKEVRPKLAYLIETAKDRAVELGELTREDAEKVGDYLRRDIEDAAAYLAGSTRSELVEWLRFDIQMVEKSLLDLFTSVADKTRVELLALERQAERGAEYHTGEVTGIGTLRCAECGQIMHFHTTGHIPPCPKCRATRFVRPAA